MTPSDEPTTPAGDALADQFLDWFVFAPIGLVLDAEVLAPDLAKRGRQHSAAARQIGELVVKKGVKRLDEVLSQASDPAGSERSVDPTSVDPTRPSGPVGPESENSESSAHLTIPDYDLLAASQVIKRLDSLAGDELEAVRAYESQNRDRRTILHKIARLQD